MSSEGTVKAQRPTNRSIRRLYFDERVTPSLWFLPTLIVIGAIVVSRIVVAIDRALDAERAPGWLLGADPSASASLATTVAAAMLSFAAVVFSTTLVAIQLAGGQYSPRIVRVFVRSRLTQVTLGIFLATFVFAINAVVEERGGDDPYVPAWTVAIVYVSVLATLFAFIAFVHGMSRLLRVQYLLARVTDDARPWLQVAFAREHTDAPLASADGATHLVRNSGPRVGVVQAIDVVGLAAVAEATQVRVELLVSVGEYVGIGTPVAAVHGHGGDALPVVDSFLLGPERTLTHDPMFVFRQLVDVAIRALSPAVNDPTTAVQCIDRIADLLAGVVVEEDPSGWYTDAGGQARVRVVTAPVAAVLLLAFTEIIRYGADSPQVTRRLEAAFDVLDGLALAAHRATLVELRQLLVAARRAALPAAFVDVASTHDRRGLG